MTNRRINELRLQRRQEDGQSIFDMRYWSIERWITVIGVILAVSGFYWRMQALDVRVDEKFASFQAQVIELRKDVKEELAKLQTRELAEAQRTALQKQLDDNAHRIDQMVDVRKP